MFKPPWVWIREDWEAKQKRFREPRKPRSRAMRWVMWTLLAIVLVVALPILFLLFLPALLIFNLVVSGEPEQLAMTVDVSGHTLVLERKSIQSRPPEYARTLIVYRGSDEVGRASLPLGSGGERLNIYQIDENTLVLHDQLGPVALHLRDARLSPARDIPRARVPGTFLGAFDRVEKIGRDTYRFVPAGERREQSIAVQNPQDAWPPSRWPNAPSQGEWLFTAARWALLA